MLHLFRALNVATEGGTPGFWDVLKTGFMDGILPSLPFLLIGVVFLWIAKLVNDALTPYRMDEELTEKDNPAVGIATMGYYVGIAIAISGSFLGESRMFWQDVQDIALYAVMAIIMVNIARYINDYLILYRFRNTKELVEDRNVGTGAVIAGGSIATGLIIRASIGGEGGGWLVAIVFFLLGQAVLVIAGLWYQLITSYDVHKVIGEDNNAAAGCAFGAFLLAVGYLVHAGMLGNFSNWSTDLAIFLIYVVSSFILLAIVRLITDLVFLPKARLSKEVSEQANMAAALIAVGVYIAAVVIITHAV